VRTAARAFGAPALLVVAAATVFHRAFAPAELAVPVALALVVGAVAGALLAARRLPWILGLVATVAGAVLGAAVVARTAPTPTLVPDAFLLFLTVGLPARGLPTVAVVPFVVLLPAMAASVAASLRHRTLPTLAGPVVAVAVGSLLVEPVGFAWWVPIAVALAAGAVLVADARNDVSQLPPLVGANTEARRQVVWWRPLVQVVPALLAVLALAAVLPRDATVDVRDHVAPASERLADVNPLAVAARAPRLDPAKAPAVATVTVDGPSVPATSRLRLAVLDRYGPGGWRQSADYSITGETLAADPVLAAADAVDADPDGLAPATAEVVVARAAGAKNGGPFRGVPTLATPVAVADPEHVRYAPRAGVLLADGAGRTVRYRADVTEPPSGDDPDVSVGRFPPELGRCPASDVIGPVAQQVTAGAVTTEDRLARIENFLKVRRVYDPAAPGGQTLRSVERFLEQDFARGDLEVFVTSYALLARCAGVPLRVVVGLPAPPPDATTTYTRADVTAWVETPLVRAGWSPRDPLPTPEEQRQQAQLARRPEPPEPEEPPTTTPPAAARPVTPRPLTTDRDPPIVPILAVLAAVLLLIAAWTFALPTRVIARRRRAADPSVAVMGAWRTVTDALVDREIGLDAHHTPGEAARLLAGHLPPTVPRLVASMAPLVDEARYSGEPVADETAARAWAYAVAIVERLPRTWPVRLAALRCPRRALERLRDARRVAVGPTTWRGALPSTALVSGTEAPTDIPDVTIDAQIGEGSTGTVYRGVRRTAPGGDVAVAVKVFRFGPGDAGFDEPRFDWEVRVARQVSGLPHLPVVHDAGITPVSQRPYLVSSLAEGGTLLDRVRRGGPMTTAEAVAIGADVATALICLHQLGVVHGDVKPENVFAGTGGEGWTLGDLGSAWLRATRGPAATLTPPYAAPEVWRGAAPSPAADLYSLALTMRFAVTGEVPIASVAPDREDVLAAFPDHPVVLRALDPDVRRRPRSVADFLRQLRPDLAGTPAAVGLRALSLPTPTVSHGR
jgi:hypothetical protein